MGSQDSNFSATMGRRNTLKQLLEGIVEIIGYKCRIGLKRKKDLE
jgi:hypothetical protein